MTKNPTSRVTEIVHEFEPEPTVKPTGFREYDARWIFKEEINLKGVQLLGLGLGTLAHELKVEPKIVVAHDYRSYSESIKFALINGLLASGMKIVDIGMALTPMAYFAQFELDILSVAMVTASHNENGWTGVKMGMNRPLTFGPEEMSRLKSIVLESRFEQRDTGSYEIVDSIATRYSETLTNRRKLTNPIKVVVACGNGTAGAFAPQILEKIGAEVIPLDCELDYDFPNYNPNPEDLKMLNAMSEKVIETGADLGLGFDGDGDRCGVVDNEGNKIFADKVGVLLARDISELHRNAKFVADVKSTGLFATDSVLMKNSAKTEYYRTGHSYMKQRVFETHAVAGFEKSGHFFFNEPIGRGYDDGLVSAIAVLDMLDKNFHLTLAELYKTLPKTWASPTMAPECADELKYGVVERFVRQIQDMERNKSSIGGHPIIEVNTVNGARIVCDDGTWGLIRASSNKPELVVVVESPVSEERMKEMFNALDLILRGFPEVGAYNQTL